jgi:hypothetical protein
MTSRYVLTYSNDGIAQAKQEVIQARSGGSRPVVTGGRRRGVRARGAADMQSLPRFIVGIWSLEGWLTDLGGMIDRLNKAQSTFLFYEVNAVVPAGLISGPERVARWYQEASGRRPSKRVREQLKDNVVADDFFGLAEKIRTDMGLDYVIGVTASMVSFFEDSHIYWNYFSTFDGRALLASSYQLHEFARDTGWPFEAFLAKIIVSQLLVAIMWPKFGFHPDTGCLFDFDESRVSLKDKVKDPHVEPGCLELMDPVYRPAALAFVDLLRSYRGAT